MSIPPRGCPTALARKAAGCDTVGDLMARPELVAELPLTRLERRALELAVARLREHEL